MVRTYLLFRSTHDTLKAESVLQGAGLACRVVQKPAGIRLCLWTGRLLPKGIRHNTPFR